MMGGAGLTQATRVAILNAQLYRRAVARGPMTYCFMGKQGPPDIAHECILDTRPFAEAGVTVDDIAKRLIDNGFHRANHELAGRGHADGGTHGYRKPRQRLTASSPPFWPFRDEIRAVEEGEIDAKDSPPALCSPHGRRPDRRLGPCLYARSGLLSACKLSGRQVLAARGPGGQCVR